MIEYDKNQRKSFMTNPIETNGMFSWFEFMTSDLDKAKKFYGEVIGWEFVQDINNPNYTLVKTQGAEFPVAGILKRENTMVENAESIPSHWGSYITVKNIDAAVQKAKQLGGNIIVPVTPIPKVGKFSVLQDLEGAVISLIEYHLELS